MNRIYRLVFNHTTGQMQVASELANTHSSPAAASSSARRRSPLCAALAVALSLAVAPSAFAQVYEYTADESISSDRAYADGFRVGPNGQVTVNVFGTAVLTSLDLVSLGTTATGNGTLALDGPGAALRVTNGAAMRVGDAGIGTLRLSGGSTADISGFLSLGYLADSTGSTVIDGTGSNLTARRVLVGRQGTGTLDISNGGSLVTDEIYTPVNDFGLSIGSEAGGTGTVNVASGGSIRVTDNNLLVGRTGTGTLNINDQGTVIADRRVSLGEASTASGTVNVNAGGTLRAQEVVIGHAAHSTGFMTVSGANALVEADAVWVGSSGSGTLRVDNGGVVRASSELIAENYDGFGSGEFDQAGTIIVSGSGSAIEAGTVRTSNHLLIENGGSIRSDDARVKDTYSPVDGVATITGAGSNWTNTGLMDIRSGMDILNGGVVSSKSITIAGGSNYVTSDLARVNEQVRVSGNGSQLLASDGITVERHLVGELYGVLNVSNGGHADGGTGITLGTSGYLVVGGSIGNWVQNGLDSGWSAAKAAGTLGAGRIIQQNAAGGLVFNHTGNIVLANDISSHNGNQSWTSGALTQVAGNTTLSGDLTAFGGKVNVSGGVLRIDSDMYTGQGYNPSSQAPQQQIDVTGGTLVLNGGSGFQQTISYGAGLGSDVIRSSSVTVRGSGVLAGNATVGTTHVYNGGTLSPGGRGVGSMIIDGDLYLNSNRIVSNDVAQAAVYDVQLRANGQADMLNVTGTAYIGSTSNRGTSGQAALRVDALDGMTSYQKGQTYTVLEAAEGIQGKFDTLPTNSPFLQSKIVQVGNQVQIVIQVDNTWTNEPDPGTPVDPTNPTNPTNPVVPPVTPVAPGGPIVFGRAASTANQRGVAAGLDSLQQSGEALALYNGLLMLDEASARTAFDELSGEVHASNRAMLLDDRFLREGIGQRLRQGTDADGVSAWLAGSGNSKRRDGDGSASRVRQNTSGVMAGADWSMDGRWTLGLAAGTESLRQQVNGRNAETEVDAVHGGLYAGFRGQSLWVNGGLSYADYQLDTERAVGAAQAWSQTLRSRYDADAVSAFTEAGWDIALDRLTLTPYLGVAYTRLSTDDAVEYGGSAALAVASSKDEVWTTTAGVRAAWDISGGQRDGARLEAGLAWQNAAGELRADSRNQFVAGSDTFTVYGLPLARNVGIAELGVSLKPTDNSRLSLHAQGRAGDGQREFGAQLNWSVTF